MKPRLCYTYCTLLLILLVSSGMLFILVASEASKPLGHQVHHQHHQEEHSPRVPTAEHEPHPEESSPEKKSSGDDPSAFQPPPSPLEVNVQSVRRTPSGVSEFGGGENVGSDPSRRDGVRKVRKKSQRTSRRKDMLTEKPAKPDEPPDLKEVIFLETVSKNAGVTDSGYLAHGDSVFGLSRIYRMGVSTVRSIVREVCEALWGELSQEYMPIPGEADWKKISTDFFEKWNFPHCCGAVDGKHVAIQCPRNAGSEYFNYKKFHSINLMAVCDADYNFVAVDVGAYGGNSDGSVLAHSAFGKLLLENRLGLPVADNLPYSPMKVPYFIVGDAAFPLKDNLMRPYPGKQLPNVRDNFNQRLSRARRTIENAFGILVARWRILKNTLVMEPASAEKLVLACVILHNFVKKHTNAHNQAHNAQLEAQWNNFVEPLQGINPAAVFIGNNSRQSAYRYRDIVAEYLLLHPLQL